MSIIGLGPRNAAILFAVILACFSIPLNFTAGPTAQPYIANDLGGSAVALSWITNAFFLSCGSTLMVAGVMADQFGRKKIFAIGMLVSTLMSLLMPIVPSVVVLDMLRVPQGIAAACAYSGGIAILAQEFEGQARAKVFSGIGITFGAGLAFGPSIAAVLITHYGWQAVFYGSTAISLTALAFCLAFMRDSKNPSATGLDKKGAILFTGMLGLFTYAVIEAPLRGWGSPLILSLFLLVLLLLPAFIMVEKRVANPLLDLSLFSYPEFLGVQLLPLAAAYCYAVLLVLLPLRFIGIENMSAMDAGILMIYFSGPLLFIPFLAATMARYVPVGVLAGCGMLISIAGLVCLYLNPGDSQGWQMKAILMTIGAGVAVPWGLMDNLAVSVVPKEKAGMAIGIFGALRVSFDSTAIAIVGSLLALFMSNQLTNTGYLSAGDVAAATAQLAAGDMDTALRLLPGASKSQLMSAYNDAFRDLVAVLIALTSVSTLLVFVLLWRTKVGGELEKNEMKSVPEVAA